MVIEKPSTGIVDEFSIMRKRKPTVTLVVKRDVVEPTLFRNTDPTRAEIQRFGDDEYHAQANGEKFTSKERLTGLDLLRKLQEDHEDLNLIKDSYTYNEDTGFSESINMDALTYGLVGTGDSDFAMKSRVIEGYTYTSEEYDLMDEEARNAIYETGTMRDEENEQARSLFKQVRVQPGNSFIHFVTLESATAEMLLYVIHNILNTSRYGAKETRTGHNMENKIIGTITGDYDTTLSTGELLMDYHDGEDIVDSTKEYIEEVSQENWNFNINEMPDWVENMKKIATRRVEDAEDQMASAFDSLTESAREELTE